MLAVRAITSVTGKDSHIPFICINRAKINAIGTIITSPLARESICENKGFPVEVKNIVIIIFKPVKKTEIKYNRNPSTDNSLSKRLFSLLKISEIGAARKKIIKYRIIDEIKTVIVAR